MIEINLIKREYLGRANFAQFKNIETGEVKFKEVSDAQFTKIFKKKEGQKYNPKDTSGWVYLQTYGGSLKLDTEDGNFGVGDYTVITDPNDPEFGYYFVCLTDNLGIRIFKYSEEEFSKNFNK